MTAWKGLFRRIEANRDVCFDLLRIYLGVGLFVKGLQFVWADDFLLETLRKDSVAFAFKPIKTMLAHYIVVAHLGGGVLLATGFLTRFAALIQLPILFGAAFLVYAREGILTHNQDFQFTALVLVLLILILVHGSGRLSTDHYLKNR